MRLAQRPASRRTQGMLTSSLLSAPVRPVLITSWKGAWRVLSSVQRCVRQRKTSGGSGSQTMKPACCFRAQRRAPHPLGVPKGTPEAKSQTHGGTEPAGAGTAVAGHICRDSSPTGP